MRLVCISDTHSFEQQINVPDGDVLIHAGDLTRIGNIRDVIQFNDWLGSLSHRHKLIIAGNHDYCFEPEELRESEAAEGRNATRRRGTGLKEGEEAAKLITNATYLFDTGTEIDGVKFYGSPWQPVFYYWAFNLRRGQELAEIWKKIPEDTHVLITHGPPHGILDRTARGENVGCEQLLARIAAMPGLKVHVFGHIHEGYGLDERNGKRFVNASTCTLDYEPANEPIVVDL